MARAVQRGTAKRHQPRALRPRRDGDRIAGAEHHHRPGLETLIGDDDRPFGDVNPTILVIFGQREPRAGGQRHIQIKGFRITRCGRVLTLGMAQDQIGADACILNHRQAVATVMLEDRVHILAILGQGGQGLDSIKAARPCTEVRAEWVTPLPATIQLTAPGRIT